MSGSGKSEESDCSEEDIWLYALDIGINPESEPELLWLAREAIFSRLPPGWAKSQDDSGKPIFHNHYLQTSTKEHPSKVQYSQLVTQERERIQRTAAVGGGQQEKKENEQENNTHTGFFCSGFLSVIDSRCDEKSSLTLLTFDDEENSVISEKEDFGVPVSNETEMTKSEMQDNTHSVYQSSESLMQLSSGFGGFDDCVCCHQVRDGKGGEKVETEALIYRSSRRRSDLNSSGNEIHSYQPDSETEQNQAHSENLTSESTHHQVLSECLDCDSSVCGVNQMQTKANTFSKSQDGSCSTYLYKDIHASQMDELKKDVQFLNSALSEYHPEMDVQGKDDKTDASSSQGQQRQKCTHEKVLVHAVIESTIGVGGLEDERIKGQEDLIHFSPELSGESSYSIRPASLVFTNSQDESESSGEDVLSYPTDQKNCHIHPSAVSDTGPKQYKKQEMLALTTVDKTWSLDCSRDSPKPSFADSNTCGLHDNTHFIQIKERKDIEKTVVSKSTDAVGQLGTKLMDEPSKAPTFADCNTCVVLDSTDFIQIKERMASEKTVTVSKSSEAVGKLGAKLEDESSKTPTDSAVAIRDGDLGDEITELEAQSEDQSPESLQREVSERVLDSSDSVFETETSTKSQGESGNNSSVEEVYSDIVAQEHVQCDSTDENSEVKRKLKLEEELTRTTRVFTTSYTSAHALIKQTGFPGTTKIEQAKDKKEVITTPALTDFFDSDGSLSDSDSQTETDQDSKSQYSIDGSGFDMDMKKEKPIKTPEVLKEPFLRPDRIYHAKLSEESKQADKPGSEESLVREKVTRIFLYEEKLRREEEEETRKLMKEKEKRLQLRKDALKEKEEEEMTRFEKELDKKMFLHKKKLDNDADQLMKKKEMHTQYIQEELMKMHHHHDRLSKEKEKEMEQLRKEEMRIWRQKEIRREQEEALQLMRDRETRNQRSQGGLTGKKEEEAEQFNRKMETPPCMGQLRKTQEVEHLRVDREIKNYQQKEGLKKEEVDEYLRLKREKDTRICRRKVELRREEEEEAEQLKQEKEKRLRLRREELKRSEEEEEEWLKREMYNIKCLLHEELHRGRKEIERLMRERQLRMESCLQVLRREEEEAAEQLKRDKAIRVLAQKEELMKKEKEQLGQLKKEMQQRIYRCFEKLKREEAEEAEQLKRGKEMRIRHHLEELQREEGEAADILTKEKESRCFLCQERHMKQKEEEEEELQKYLDTCNRLFEEELRMEEEEAERMKQERAQKRLLRHREELERLEKEREQSESELRLQSQLEELNSQEENEELLRTEGLRKSLFIDELNKEAEEMAWLKRGKEMRIKLYDERLRKEEEDEMESLKREQGVKMSLHEEALRREEEDEIEQLQKEIQNRILVCQEQMRRERDELEKLKREKIKTKQHLPRGQQEKGIEQMMREKAMEKNLKGSEGQEIQQVQRVKRERKTSLLCEESSTGETDGRFVTEIKKKTFFLKEELTSEDEEDWLKEEIRTLLRKIEKEQTEKLANGKITSWLCLDFSTDDESEGQERDGKINSKGKEEVDVLKRQNQRQMSFCIEELKREEKEKVERLKREKQMRMHKYEEELRKEEDIELDRLKRGKEQRIQDFQEQLRVQEMEELEQLKSEKEKRMGPLRKELPKNEEDEQMKLENQRGTRPPWDKQSKQEEEQLKEKKDTLRKEKRMNYSKEELLRKEYEELCEIDRGNGMCNLQEELKRGTEELIDKLKAEKQKRMRLRQIDVWGEEEEKKLKTEYKYRLRALRQCLLAKRKDEENLFNKLFGQENLTDSVRMERKDEQFHLRQDHEAALRALCHALEEEREAKRDRFTAQRRQFLEHLRAHSNEDLQTLPTRLQEGPGENLRFMTPEAQEKILDSGFCSTFHLSTVAAPEPQIEKFGAFRLTPQRMNNAHFTVSTSNPLVPHPMTANLAPHLAPESLFCHQRAAAPVDPFTTMPLSETYLASSTPGFCNQLSLNKFNEITVYRFRRQQNIPCDHIFSIQE
ncbi:uncharacterized protein LOC144083224 isoform X2 [Stigmatopora argus]